MYNIMTEVYFYHSTAFPVEKTIAKLVEKIYGLKQNIIILCQDTNLIQIIDDLLWSYSTKTFLAHATEFDPSPQQQPIYITSKEENPNNSTVLISIGENIPNFYRDFEKYITIFANSDSEVQSARARYKHLKNENMSLKYFKQKDDGTWDQT
jgi:DNA polymerase-3 subunit chi